MKQKEIVFSLLVICCAKDRVPLVLSDSSPVFSCFRCHNAGRESSHGETPPDVESSDNCNLRLDRTPKTNDFKPQ